MRAAVVRDFQRPIAVEDVPVPVIGRDEVLVKIETSGLCHTDIHAAHGEWPVKPSLPFIPGHEGVGIIERVGSEVTRVGVGDQVAVPWLGWACGACEHCASGWETLCLQQRNTGYSVNGGYAEYVKASADFVGLVLDVHPAELGAGKFSGEREKSGPILHAGIAPLGAKAAHHHHA